MKKRFLFIALRACLASFGQIKDEITLENGSKFLLGQITQEDLKKEPYLNWYQDNYSKYQINNESVDSFAEALKQHNVLLFMGTWCGDSKREVPKMVKILNEADFPKEQLKIVAVDRRKEFYKKSPNGEEWGLDIRRVPTLIFLKNGKEVNRIVESPISSLEEDFSSILNGDQYTPNYSMVNK